MCLRCTNGARRAFTLVEVLVIIVIIGIAAAVVVPQMLSPGTLHVQAAARMVIADLLYAQNEAIAEQRGRRVVFDPDNNRYWLSDLNGDAIDVKWKKNSGAGNYVVDFNADSRFMGVNLGTVDFGGNKQVDYDVLGGPSSGGTIDLSANGIAYRVTIAPLTGRVTVAPQ